LIHVAPADHCTDAAAALAAAISSAFLPAANIESCIDNALRCVRATSGAPFRARLSGAIELAVTSGSYAVFRTEFQDRYSQPIFCDAMETVPAALGLALLARGEPKTAVEYGANFGRDADTIASMAGALTGALAGDIPAEWIDSLDEAQLCAAEQLASDLAAAALEKTRSSRDEASVTLGILEGL
jgi:ADP-ribosylglycohydrolase